MHMKKEKTQDNEKILMACHDSSRPPSPACLILTEVVAEGRSELSDFSEQHLQRKASFDEQRNTK